MPNTKSEAIDYAWEGGLMKESCKRLMAERKRVIWVFVLMTTGWQMGIHSQSDQGLAGEKGRHEMHLYGWENPPRNWAQGCRWSCQGASQEHPRSIGAAASPPSKAHCTAPRSSGDTNTPEQMGRSCSGNPQPALDTHSCWRRLDTSSANGEDSPLLLSLFLCSSALTEHSEMLKMGLSVIFTVSYHQGWAANLLGLVFRSLIC